MAGLAVLVGLLLLVGVFVGLSALAVVWLVLRAVLWLVVLPFRLLFWAVTLPLLALFGIVGAVLLAVGGLVVAAIVLGALIVPLLPLILLVGVVWALVHLMKRPAPTAPTT